MKKTHCTDQKETKKYLDHWILRELFIRHWYSEELVRSELEAMERRRSTCVILSRSTIQNRSREHQRQA